MIDKCPFKGSFAKLHYTEYRNGTDKPKAGDDEENPGQAAENDGSDLGRAAAEYLLGPV